MVAQLHFDFSIKKNPDVNQKNLFLYQNYGFMNLEEQNIIFGPG